MSYYHLIADRDSVAFFTASEIYDAEEEMFDSDDFTKEKPFDEAYEAPLTMILLERNSVYQGKELTDFITVNFPGYFPCVNKKTKKIFEDLKIPMSFHPLQIKGKKIDLVDQYYLMSPKQNMMKCMDLEKSTYKIHSTFENTKGEVVKQNIGKIDSLVFDESKISKDVQCFAVNLGVYARYSLWITEELKAKLLKHNLTGIKLTKLDQFSCGI